VENIPFPAFSLSLSFGHQHFWTVSIFTPQKIEVLITANRLRNPFLSSFLASINILQKTKNFKCFFMTVDIVLLDTVHSVKKKRRVENTQSSQ